MAISTVTRELSNKVLPKFLYKEHGFCLFIFGAGYQIGGSTYHDLALRANHRNIIEEGMIEGTDSYVLWESPQVEPPLNQQIETRQVKHAWVDYKPPTLKCSETLAKTWQIGLYSLFILLKVTEKQNVSKFLPNFCHLYLRFHNSHLFLLTEFSAAFKWENSSLHFYLLNKFIFKLI